MRAVPRLFEADVADAAERQALDLAGGFDAIAQVPSLGVSGRHAQGKALGAGVRYAIRESLWLKNPSTFCAFNISLRRVLPDPATFPVLFLFHPSQHGRNKFP